jgi:hypothetical protein
MEGKRTYAVTRTGVVREVRSSDPPLAEDEQRFVARSPDHARMLAHAARLLPAAEFAALAGDEALAAKEVEDRTSLQPDARHGR